MTTKELLLNEIEQIPEPYFGKLLEVLQTFKKNIEKENPGLGGILKGVRFTEEEIAAARHECWGTLGDFNNLGNKKQ